MLLLQEAFRAFHSEPNAVRKFLKPLHIGSIPDNNEQVKKDEAVKKDFEELRETAIKMVSGK